MDLNLTLLLSVGLRVLGGAEKDPALVTRDITGLPIDWGLAMTTDHPDAAPSLFGERLEDNFFGGLFGNDRNLKWALL